jgi:DNA polymerase I-like protein with 3'-5' exonuclease and polymerase domains
MDLITLDFETYYDKEFSLKKLTTEEYIRDPRFEVIGVGIKVNHKETEWASGKHEQLSEYLRQFPWEDSMLVCHNTMFDGAILGWHFGIHPRVYADTMCIARAIHGVEVSASLQAVSEKYGVGTKGTEVVRALGKHRADFTHEEISNYGDYCINDVDLTFRLFMEMANNGKFPRSELKLIDLTLRMFIQPVLDLDLGLLEQHLIETRYRKDTLLEAAGVTKEDLMSNPKFAEILQSLGVKPPTKISLTTGKETFAFAKTDEEFLALAEHDNEQVQTLVAARLGTKSTLEETRTQRFIDISKRGLLPVPVRYYAAHTGRWGGDDKINLQNLPNRGADGKKLKNSIIAPEGHTLIDADSAQIEARVLAWLAEQKELTKAFAKGEDVYTQMASHIYGLPEEKITKEQRFVGKTTILGAGYGMGAPKFAAQLKNFGFDMNIGEARRVIKIYRDTNWEINKLWRDAHRSLVGLTKNEKTELGVEGVLEIVPEETAIRLPSGLLLRYDDLQFEQVDENVTFTYKTRKGRTNIYGGKVIENVCQAVARCIIGEQMLKIAKKYRVALTVHDSVLCCVKDEEVYEAEVFIAQCMCWTPDWAKGLPISCESGIGKSYGECG